MGFILLKNNGNFDTLEIGGNNGEFYTNDLVMEGDARMEVCKYDEVKQVMKQDFDNFISESSNHKLTISGLTSMLFNDFFVMIKYNEAEKIMFYTQLALKSIEHGELRDDVRKEVTDIIEKGRLSKFIGMIDKSDFDEIKADLEIVKVKLAIL